MKISYCNIKNIYTISMKIFEPNTPPNGYILALHGFCGDMESSFIEQLADRMCRHGVAVVAFNFPGHGSSNADSYFSLENCRRDMADVMRYANRIYGVTRPEAVVGTSFGGYVTLLNLSAIPQDTRIIMRAPAVNMKRSFEMFLKDMDSFRKTGCEEMGFERKLTVPYSFYTELLDNQILERDLRRELMIVHGDRDTVVLPEDMRTFCMANSLARLEVIEGADHRFKGKGQLEKVLNISERYLFEEEV